MKPAKVMILSLILFGLTTACSKDENSTVPEFKLATPDAIDAIDYQVYTVVLKQAYSTSTYFVVNQKTATVKSITSSDKTYKTALVSEFPNLDQTIFTNFTSKNDKIYNFDSKFEIAPTPFKLLSTEENDYDFKTLGINEGWKAFHKQYGESNGIIDFSRIGFNNAKDQAVLETGRYTASLAAEGAIIYLVKENNIWKVKKILKTWVS